MSLSRSLALSLLAVSLSPAPPLHAQLTEAELKNVVALIERGDLRQAEAKLQDGLKADPRSVVGHRLLGIVCLRQGKAAEAEQTLEEAARLSGYRDPQTLFFLSQTKFALRKAREALDFAARAGALAGNDSAAHYSLGRLLRENAFPQEALRELEKARDLAPRDAAVSTELVAVNLDLGRSEEAENILAPLLAAASYGDLLEVGSRLGEAGNFSAAERAFARAVELRPDHYDAQFNLAFAQYHEKKMPDALGTLDRIAGATRNLPGDYHYLRAQVEAALGQDPSAGEQFLRAHQLDPANESLCTEGGLFFFQHDNFWKALAIFEACARHLPDSVEVGTGLALTQFRLGRYDDAGGTFRKVLALRPESDAARQGLAFLLYVSGRSAEARPLLEERLGGQDVDFYIYYLHALVLLRLDARANRDGALRSLEEALRRDPRFAPAHFQRGKVLFEQGDLSQALTHFETATRLDPAYAPPYYPMAQIYFKLGKMAEAARSRERFAALAHEQEETEQKRQVQGRLVQSLR